MKKKRISALFLVAMMLISMIVPVDATESTLRIIPKKGAILSGNVNSVVDKALYPGCTIDTLPNLTGTGNFTSTNMDAPTTPAGVIERLLNGVANTPIDNAPNICWGKWGWRGTRNIDLDLGEEAYMTGADFWENASAAGTNYCSDKIAVYTSDDGAEWTLQKAVTVDQSDCPNSLKGTRVDFDAPVKCRYVRVAVIDNAGYQVKFNEVVLRGNRIDGNDSCKINYGETLELIAKKGEADEIVNWTSSNENVATVKNGVIITLGVGTTTITATTTDESISADYTITVLPIVQFDKKTISIIEDQQELITATVLPDSSPNKKVIWTSSDEDVATVKDGVVTAVYRGNAVITARVEGGEETAFCDVTVTSLPVRGITLDETEIRLTKGETKALKATVLPITTSDKGVLWLSSDESVATVDSFGEVRAVAGGEAIITAKTTSGGYTATCKVKVEEVVATGISLSMSSANMVAGEKLELVATVHPDNATEKNVDWFSSNWDAAIVMDGVVTAIAEGETRVIARTKDGSYTATCDIVVSEGPDAVIISGDDCILSGNVTTEADKALYPGCTIDTLPNLTGTGNFTSTNMDAPTTPAGVIERLLSGVANTPIDNAPNICWGKWDWHGTRNIDLDLGEEAYVTGADFWENASAAGTNYCSDKIAVYTSDDGAEWTLQKAVTVDQSDCPNSLKGTRVDFDAPVKCRYVRVAVIDNAGYQVKFNEVVLRGYKKDAYEVITVGEIKKFELMSTSGEIISDEVVWASSNENIATVKDGVVTGLSKGNIKITAETADGKTVTSCDVKVIVPTTGIELNIDKIRIGEGESINLSATIAPDDADYEEIEWTSSNKSVATVKNGVVTAVSCGTAEIIARVRTSKDEYSQYEAKCDVSVASAKNVIEISRIYISNKNYMNIVVSMKTPLEKWGTAFLVLYSKEGELKRVDIAATFDIQDKVELKWSADLSVDSWSDYYKLFWWDMDTLKPYTDPVVIKFD